MRMIQECPGSRVAGIASLLIPMFWAVTGSAQQPSAPRGDRLDAARAAIRQVMDSSQVPAIAVAVARNGNIIWEEGFGWADRENRIPATPHTMFSLASISKPITASGLMRLVEEGKVDLDAPANRYLGSGKITGLAGDAEQATVRRVLSHTAGLPLHYRFYYANLEYGEPTMDQAIGRYAILVYPPGSYYQYSNLGYGIIDHIIARVSGMSYPEYMRTNVFEPLGLSRMSVHIPPGWDSLVAQRYDSKLVPIPFYDFDHDGGSAVYASAHDLVKFGVFFLKERLPGQQKILADSTIDQMHRSWTPSGSSLEYGLGWFFQNDFGWRRVTHTGGMPGVSTVLALYPEERTAVVVLANKSATPVGRILQDILSLVLPGVYADSLAARRRAVLRQAERTRFSAPAELAGEWKGTLRTWERSIPFRLLFKPDGEVEAELDGGASRVSDVAWANGLLVGRFAGTIPTPDARIHPHSVLLQMRLIDGKLKGQASAQTTEEPVYFAVTSYLELAR